MKVARFAVGMAAGYVLGARAGRGRYEQIAARARKLAGHPAIAHTQAKVNDLVDAGTQAATAKIDAAADAVIAKITPGPPAPKSSPRTTGAITGG